MSGGHKTQSLKLNLTCLTKPSLAQQGIQKAEHVQKRMICCIHWKKLDLKAGSVKKALCRPYTTHFRRTWTHCLGMMELEHFAWDFFLSLVLSDIDLFYPAFKIVISCCFRTFFSAKKAWYNITVSFQLSWRTASSLINISIYYYICLKNEIVADLKWEPSPTSSLPHKISKHLK